jgi:biotin-[acetyl-CoA-carboxylase] ligase BirA-like protein
VGDLSGLSLAVGVALADWCAESKVEVRLKWPNDVLSPRGDKLAGVLIELLNREGVTFVLIGVGMNLSQAPKEVPHATCLAALTEGHWTRDQVLAGVAEHVRRVWELFEARGMEAFVEPWSRVAWGMGAPLRVQQGEQLVTGEMQGIAPDGALLIRQESGAIARVTSGILV